MSESLRCKLQKLLAVVLFLSALLALLYQVPHYEQVCSKNEYTYEKECTSAHVLTVFLRKFGAWIDSASVAVSAMAAAASAAVATMIMLLNRSQGAHARTVDRAYVTGGGDIVDRDGKQFFRFDVENHGKTPAFTVAYDVQFAKLATLQEEFPRARAVCKRHLHSDGISPDGARKEIYTYIERRDAADDAVYGAVWYEDIWGEPHRSRFIMRIAEKRDIKGEGLTRLDVGRVSEDYSSWDYPKKSQKDQQAKSGHAKTP